MLQVARGFPSGDVVSSDTYVITWNRSSNSRNSCAWPCGHKSESSGSVGIFLHPRAACASPDDFWPECNQNPKAIWKHRVSCIDISYASRCRVWILRNSVVNRPGGCVQSLPQGIGARLNHDGIICRRTWYLDD